MELASSTNIRGSVRIAQLAGRVKTAGNKSSYNCTELGENWSFGGTAARARDSVKQGYVLFVKEKGLLWFPRQEEAAFCLYYTTELDQICPFLEKSKKPFAICHSQNHVANVNRKIIKFLRCN